MATVDGLRVYVRTLRKAKGLSQEALAIDIKLSLRAYQEWETGVTATMKAGKLFRIVSSLDASVDDVAYFLEEPRAAEEGEARAVAWLHEKDKVRAQKLRDDKDPEELRQVFDELRAEYARQHDIIGLIRAWMSGWRSRYTVLHL